MFRALGASVARYWGIWLLSWIAGYVCASIFAPSWETVAKDGEFDFLPDRLPSRQGDKLFQQAFPSEKLASSVVIIASREKEPLTNDEQKLIAAELASKLKSLSEFEDSPERSTGGGLISRIRSPSDDVTGPLLVSQDERAMLVIVSLRSDFLDLRNREVLKQIEAVIAEARADERFPAGVQLTLTGSATVGRDLSAAKSQSARATEVMTLVLVIVLLTVIYRAPLPALIPLVTVFVSVKLAVKLLSILALHGVVGVFDGVQTYITVIVYGAGVDYCLFLTARYKEDLDAGMPSDKAMVEALSNVGAAITASAGTVIGGIGMMVTAEFGKFQQAGVAISFSLVVVLLASLTLSASILRLAGKWAFWPARFPTNDAEALTHSPQSTSEPISNSFWDRVGGVLLRCPGRILLISFGLMLPLSAVAFYFSKYLSYGLVAALSATAPSVIGTKELQAHFPAGMSGPLTLLVKHSDVDFRDAEGREVVERLTNWLVEKRDDLKLADVRSATKPLGITSAAERATDVATGLQAIARRRLIQKKASEHYISSAEDNDGHVARFELIFAHDPFSRDAIDLLDRAEPILKAGCTEHLPSGSVVRYLGPTASIRDLKSVRTGDQTRISLLVCLSVFAILVVLLRRPFVSLYLIASVLISYVTTYGATFITFWALDPVGFAGLDWKLPMLLFTILVAVGEDYNIFLMARVEEEQKRHGSEQGIIVALTKTGRIISSCGIIMAGTFSALMFGSLVSSRQLGFALAFGVLLDTFLVRPILVPAFLILLERWRRNSADTSAARSTTDPV